MRPTLTAFLLFFLVGTLQSQAGELITLPANPSA
ncbi:MAG: hypothetical protein ACI8XO_001635, partial [Verrucomicrobiales bacterium]